MSVGAAALEVIWHDVECGAYAADLALWDELAGAAAGPVAELGSGTGRVALALAHPSREVVAVERSPALAEELTRRAIARGLEVDVLREDARAFRAPATLAAIVAPMQFLHLFSGAVDRGAVFATAAAQLEPGGIFAAALLDAGAADAQDLPDGPPPLPDVLERDGWIYSSLPVAVGHVAGALEVSRLRQRVSPAGELTEATDTIRLTPLSPAQLEAEAAEHGFSARERVAVAATEDHVGSVVCVLEARR